MTPTTSRLSKTGKPLCEYCSKPATHEGEYAIIDGKPDASYFCEEHATVYSHVIPMKALEAALEILSPDIPTHDAFRNALHDQGVRLIDRATTNDALWFRYPNRFVFSKRQITSWHE